MVVRHLVPGTFLLHVDFRDPAKPDKRMTLFFAIPDSRVQRENNVGFLVSESNSSQVLGAVADLIRQTKVSTRQGKYRAEANRRDVPFHILGIPKERGY